MKLEHLVYMIPFCFSVSCSNDDSISQEPEKEKMMNPEMPSPESLPAVGFSIEKVPFKKGQGLPPLSEKWQHIIILP